MTSNKFKPGYFTARCQPTHVEIRGVHYAIKYTLSEAPYIVVNDARMVRLTTLDTLGVEYTMVTPDPFNDLAPGLYANPFTSQRLYRKSENGMWSIADPCSDYPLSEVSLRRTFNVGALKPVTIG